MYAEQAELVQALIVVGCRMSNICFNLSQNDQIQESVRETLKEFQLEWDAAKDAADNAIVTLDKLEPAFDPIELGC